MGQPDEVRGSIDVMAPVQATLSPERWLNSEMELRVLCWEPSAGQGAKGRELGETPATGQGVFIPARASWYVEPLYSGVTDASLQWLGAEAQRLAIPGLSLRGRGQVSNTGLFQLALAVPGFGWLDLSGTAASPRGLSLFRDPSLLQTLIFQGLEAERGELAHLAQQWALAYLDLSGLHAPRQTRWDQLRGNLWEGPALQELLPLTSLRSLRLREVLLGQGDLLALAGMGTLRHLDLSGAGNLTDQGVAHLVSLHHLESLDLSGAVLGEEAVARLRALPALRELVLGVPSP